MLSLLSPCLYKMSTTKVLKDIKLWSAQQTSILQLCAKQLGGSDTAPEG